MKRIFFPLFLIIAFSGCQSSLESRITPGRSLPPKSAKYYVERLSGEDWGFNKQLAREFTLAGRPATSGEMGHAPAGDYLVTYYDQWFWDMSPYMIALEIRILDPKDREVIAWSKVRYTSLIRQRPNMMAREAIAAILAAPVKTSNPPRPRLLVPGQGLPGVSRP